MAISAAERAILDDVSMTAPWALVETFARMPRWEPGDVNRAGDLIKQRLADVGVPCELIEATMHLSVPHEASVQADNRTFRAKPMSSSASVPDGLTAPLVRLRTNLHALRSYSKDVATLFGGTISSVEEAKQLVGGRIVILDGFGNPALASLVEEWGAKALIAVNPGIDIHWGTCTTVWGSPGISDLQRKPGIPVVAVNNPDGQELFRRAEQSGVVTVRTRLEAGWFMQKIPVVDIKGAIEPEEFVLLHGHYDSWDVGVGDNATGDALMLEAARVLWKHRAKLRRSVRIAWWPGHSTGRYAGSTWFADRFASELDRNCVAQIDCDSPGCRWATSYHETRAFSESASLATDAIRDVLPKADIKIVRPPRAGDYSFNNIGLPSMYMLSSTMPVELKKEKNYYAVSGCGGNIAWHTENDTLEIADKDVLDADTRIYLLTILRIANAERLPFDWRAACAEFREAIQRYQQAAGALFDLSPSLRAVDALDAALQRLGGIGSDTRKANRAIKRLSRILVTINHVEGPRFRHDPAYSINQLPTIALAGEVARLPMALRNSALVDLVRGQNRLVAALDEATREVEQALA
jgi:hypothetical protein